MGRKKELKQSYKQTPRAMGIFQVRNLSNEKVLIGSALDLEGILNRHKFELKMGSHQNTELQKDWNDLGAERFTFEIAEELSTLDDPEHNYRDDLECLEDLWLEKLEPYGEKGYNLKKKTRGERLQMIAANKRIS